MVEATTGGVDVPAIVLAGAIVVVAGDVRRGNTHTAGKEGGRQEQGSQTHGKGDGHRSTS